MHVPHEALFEKLEKINNDFQKEWEKTPPSAKDQELHEISLEFTYNTNAIEGSTITLEEARLILDDGIAPNKLLRDIRETESHAAVFFKMLEGQEKISSTFVGMA
jgi:Fic family protein